MASKSLCRAKTRAPILGRKSLSAENSITNREGIGRHRAGVAETWNPRLAGLGGRGQRDSSRLDNLPQVFELLLDTVAAADLVLVGTGLLEAIEGGDEILIRTHEGVARALGGAAVA
jgi:hypothetical protein